MLSIVVAGLVAGLVHVLSGPDHLAAVAPYALIQGKRAWLVGLRWGVGRTSGVVVVGLFALLVRSLLPAEKLSAWSESLVGFVLIAIGVWGLWLANAFGQG